MLRTTMVFTCLPDPRPQLGTTRRLTVMVSPRLESDTPRTPQLLSDYQLGTWPTRLAASPISLDISGTVRAATLAAPADLDANVWTTLLPGNTPVKPFVFQRDTRTVRSYPVSKIAHALEDLYVMVAKEWPRDPAPIRWPATGEPALLGGLVGQVGNTTNDLREFAFSTAENSDSFLADQPLRQMFYRANRFYHRTSPYGTQPRLDAPTPTRPSLEFHQRLALLGDHGGLLRKLGLVFDVLVPTSWLPASGTVRLGLSWRAATALDVSPRTRFRSSGATFAPAPSSTALAGGYLALDAMQPDGSAAFEVVRLDTDGGAMQSASFAAAARRLMTEPTRAPVEQSTLPTLRGGGLSLVHNGRADWLAGRRTRSGLVNDGLANADLWAEDLLRGYRIDVQPEGETWQSLCRRNGDVVVTGRGNFPVADEEGYVKAASGASTPANDELYLHEVIAGWDGWSLAARRPGRTVRHDGTGESVEHIANDDAALGVTAEYRPVTGSLPRLRYGRRYRMRARAADLAGGGLRYDDVGEAHVTPWVRHGRYEPVPPPVLVLTAPITEAESVEHLVIRSHNIVDENITPCTRHILPPKATLAMAEAHGKLDGAFSASADARWFHVARMEAGTVLDRTVVNLETGGNDSVTGIRLMNPPSAPIGASDPPWPSDRGDSLGAGQYVIHTGDEVKIPYLPDPMASGVVFYDPATGQVTTVPFGSRSVSWGGNAGALNTLGDWPLKQSIRLELRPTNGGTIQVGSPSTQTVSFQLPPGRMLRLRYSSQPTGFLEQLAMWNLLENDPQRSAIANDVLAGLHWMFTPGRDLVLVHAVQRPVTGPQLIAFDLRRDFGGTAVRFVDIDNSPGAVVSHSWSTSHVDVRADWREWVDDPTDPLGLRREIRVATAFRVAIVEGQDRTPLTTVVQAVQRVPNNSNPLRGLDTPSPQPPPVEQWSVHEVGDTRHSVITYTPVGTTRFAEYFPADVIAKHENLEQPGGSVTKSVLSTVRPPAPVVMSVVPTFKWTEVSGVRTRIGRGLRIYLDWPWFQTGEGERLAVIVGGATTDTDQNLLSRWGKDPAWDAPTSPPLLASAFASTSETLTYFAASDPPVTVPRVVFDSAVSPGGIVYLAGYAPEWNDERKLWFVDVELDTGTAYWPFVSLAVARWQKASLSGCELSPVVRCEFAQLAPDRAASITSSGSSVAVSLVGLSAGNSFEAHGGLPGPTIPFKGRPSTHDGTLAAAHRVYARLERLPDGVPATAENELRWTAVTGQIELRAQATLTAETRWSGNLTIPAGTGALRCVITETEVFSSDTQTSGRERIVYLDALLV